MRISHGLRTTAQVLLTGCLFAALTPGTATGQGGYLIFQAGYFVPTGELGVLQEAGFVEAIEFGKRNRSFAYSLGLELPIASPFSGRATLAYGTSTDLPVQEVRCPDCEARSSVLMATAALVFRPLPSGLAIQPYLLAGGGVKHYDLVSLDELQRAPLRDQTRKTALVGAGIELQFGPLRLVTEVSDYVSPIFSNRDMETLQNDLFWTAGLMLGSG